MLIITNIKLFITIYIFIVETLTYIYCIIRASRKIGLLHTDTMNTSVQRTKSLIHYCIYYIIKIGKIINLGGNYEKNRIYFKFGIAFGIIIG